MGCDTGPLLSGPAVLRGLGPALLCLTVLWAAPARSETFRVNYELQLTDMPLDQIQALQQFAATNKNRYLLLHGFACDTGGYMVSIKIAETRARKAQIALLNSIDPDRVRLAAPTVIPGEPRIDHRKLTLSAFNS